MSSPENYIWVIAIVIGLAVRIFTYLHKKSKTSSPMGTRLPRPPARRPARRPQQRAQRSPKAHPRIFQSQGRPKGGGLAAQRPGARPATSGPQRGSPPNDMSKLLKELGIELPPEVAAKLQGRTAPPAAPRRAAAPAPAQRRRAAPVAVSRPAPARPPAPARAPAAAPKVRILQERRTPARPRLDLRADPTLLRDAIILQSVLGRRSR